MDWLRPQKAINQCENKSVSLMTPLGEQFWIRVFMSVEQFCMVVNQDMPIVNEYPNVFLDELPSMPPKQDIEFIIELLHGTAPMSKRPYRM
jgi:hypothetical protein